MQIKWLTISIIRSIKFSIDLWQLFDIIAENQLIDLSDEFPSSLPT